MNGKILLISLDGVRLLEDHNLSKKEIDYVEITDIHLIEKSLWDAKPDALVVQVNEIADVVIYKIRESFKRTGLSIPWVSLVMNNSAFSEKIARSNRVFYYGVGVEDVGFVIDAIVDAIKAGKQDKLQNKLLYQNYQTKFRES